MSHANPAQNAAGDIEPKLEDCDGFPEHEQHDEDRMPEIN
jgi:hypothetical protein